MSNTLAFDFSVDKENKKIVVKREFAAERALVWDAYTKSEILDQWWGPKPWKARTKTMDFREGGCWHYAMVGPSGEEHWSLVNYKTIRPQLSFTTINEFSDAVGIFNEDLPQSNWNVTFADSGDVTLVELLITFDELAQLERMIQMRFKEGLTMGMENLDALLAVLKAA